MNTSSIHSQIISLVEQSQRILLCTHRKPDGDAVGSLMALRGVLTLLGKEVVVACSDPIPEIFNFLPNLDQVSPDIPGGKDFVITLDCDKTEVDRLKYHLEDNKIHIIITPKKGHFISENVSCQERSGAFDLVMTVDVADIAQLGTLYQENIDLFTSLPLVNIDHHVSNTNFGKINHVSIQSSSTSEILYPLMKDMEKHFHKSLINPDLATFLLSGITTDTGSFQNANTTPLSMEIAADLIDAGANQHDVIKYLFRTKKLSTLKLWGRILTKIELDEKHRIVWSSITKRDLLQTGATMDEAGDIIDELLIHAPEAEMIALFKEDNDKISVSFRSTTPEANVMEVAKRFGGGGHVQAAGLKLPGKKLPEVMTQIITAMQSVQQKRLGLEPLDKISEPSSPGDVSQVLHGYTPPQSSIEPTLEEKALKTTTSTSQPLPKEADVVDAPVVTDSTKPAEALGNPVHVPPQQDLHEQARAAITAEQSQPSLSSANPSREASQKRPEKAQVPPRFMKEAPQFTREQSQKPIVNNIQEQSSSQSNDDPGNTGVSVSYGNQSTPTAPDIPEGSPEPVVKTFPVTPSPTVDVIENIESNDQSKNDENSGSDENTLEPEMPPSDPFSAGDDGLTDIERALGGL